MVALLYFLVIYCFISDFDASDLFSSFFGGGGFPGFGGGGRSHGGGGGGYFSFSGPSGMHFQF